MRCEAQLRDIARHDRAAFSALYREMHQKLISFATGLLAGDRSSAEDVVNEAFAAIWQQAGAFSGTGSAEGWIRRIVRNKAIDWLRRQREVSMSPDAEARLDRGQSDSNTSQDSQLIEVETGRQLRKALQMLSIEHREVVWLCYYEERRLSEIAQIVQCPENTVKTRLFHARKQLKASGLLENAMGG
jgi:RNA polymerase sigma-70 factor (ECF subfamily)